MFFENPAATARKSGFFARRLILVCVAVWLLFNVGSGFDDGRYALLVRRYGLVPEEFWQGEFWRMLTHQFLHGNFLHLFFNMWVLWVFGPPIERVTGRWFFLGLYLGSGVAAGFLQLAFVDYRTVLGYRFPGVAFTEAAIPIVGASGAISGLMGAFLLMFPNQPLQIILPVFCIPLFFTMRAKTAIGGYFAIQVFFGLANVLAEQKGGGVAWWAHVGGFVFGLAATWIAGRTGFLLRAGENPAVTIELPADRFGPDDDVPRVVRFGPNIYYVRRRRDR